MAPFMVPMMAFLWVHKWKLDFASLMVSMKEKMMAPLIIPMMDFLWVHKGGIYLAANVMAPLMVPMMVFL